MSAGFVTSEISSVHIFLFLLEHEHAYLIFAYSIKATTSVTPAQHSLSNSSMLRLGIQAWSRLML